MLLWRRLAFVLVVSLLVLPPGGSDLFGQDKDKDKDKNKVTEKDKDKDKEKDVTKKTTLEWKFEAKKPFFQKMYTETNQTMTVMTNKVTQTQKQTFYFSWTPLEKKGDEWVLAQKIEGVQMDIDIGGSKITFDSTAPAAAGAQAPLSEFFKQLVNSEFKVTLDMKTYKVTKVEGREDFLKKLVGANPQMKPLLDQILSEQALKEMAEPTFAVIPTTPVAKGEPWTRKSTLDMGPIGKYDNEYKYTFEGMDEKEKNLAKINVETTLKYAPPGEAAGVGGLPFKIKSADLKSTNAKGTIYFNVEKGRVEKSDMSLDLEGKLSIEIGGQTTTVDLSQKQTTRVESSDKSLLPTPAKP
jgi:hypothetical protein